MSTNASEAFFEASSDVPRDRWQRPLIVPPGGGKPVGYTRCSTFAGVLDDTYNLQKWKARQVAVGLSKRPDLQLRVVSLGPQPDKYTEKVEYRRWKSSLDEVCDAALEAAGGTTARNLGTALHAFTDRIDQGLDLGIVPEAYKPHLAAYEAATRNLTAVHIERFVVCDELQVAGTADRLLQVDGHDKLVIGDTKSGDVEFGLQKIAVQLAVYAHGQLYNHETGARASLGEVDLERAIIIALNASLGTCELIWIDIAAGWEAAKESAWVRDWRKRRGLTEPFAAGAQAALPVTPTPAQENARDLTVEARAALLSAIETAESAEVLYELWGKFREHWTPDHTAAASLRKAELVAGRHLSAVKA